MCHTHNLIFKNDKTPKMQQNQSICYFDEMLVWFRKFLSLFIIQISHQCIGYIVFNLLV